MLRYAGHDVVFQEFPDEVTLAVNLAGCPHRCPGCHSPWLRRDEGDELDEARLLALAESYRGAVTCVALMGGDADPQAVARLLTAVRERFGPRMHTGWYSGSDALPEGFRPEAFTYVKIGSWQADRGPLTSPTTNQRLYRVTPGGLEDITPLMRRRGPA